MRIFLLTIIPFVLTVIITPIIKKMAIHVNAVDIPNERKVHTKIMPRLGGIAMFLSFLFSYMILVDLSVQMISILISSFIIILTGIADDIKPLSAKVKFISQLISASIIVFYGNILLTDFGAFELYVQFGIFSPIVTIFFILGCINCINLIDGLDGLAAGTSAIFFATVGIIALVTGSLINLEVLLAFIMLGCTLGFLVHNFYPSSIFMGDSGSMFLGLIISVIALLGYKNITLTSFFVPVLILMVPILDTTFAIIRRTLSGKSFGEADKNHLHHQFLKMKFSHRSSVLIIYAINGLFSITSLIYILGNFILGIAAYVCLFIIIVWIVTTTDIIFDHNKEKEVKTED
ncbi:MAG: glycosyltransferase family 4 protein [Bacilli bacterium]